MVDYNHGDRRIPSGLGTLKAWTKVGVKAAKESEERLLSRLSYFIPSNEPIPNSLAPDHKVGRSYDFKLQNGKGHLHVLEISTVENFGVEGGEADIMLPGYGLGIGFFYENLETVGDVAVKNGRRAFIMDWYGLGVSTRASPRYFKKARKHSKDEEEMVLKAEDFFLDPLVEFVRSNKLSKVNLIGHSLGGYLCAAFALRYPDLVSSLVLLSPAGVPAPPQPSTPNKSGSSTPSRQKSTADATADVPGLMQEIEGEFETSQHRIRSNESPNALEKGHCSKEMTIGEEDNGSHGMLASDISTAPSSMLPTPVGSPHISPRIVAIEGNGFDEEDEDDEFDDPNVERKVQMFKGPRGNSGPTMRKFYAWMWETDKSPLGAIRKLGPVGVVLIAKYSRHRFNALPPSLQADLAEYLLNITCLKGSGEYCVSILLLPGAFARWPLADRMDHIKIPVGFVYGAKDWMDKSGGQEVVRNMRRNGNKQAKTVVIERAGHHLYMDNAPDTNAFLTQRLDRCF